MKPVVCVFAHPDDEAFGPAGTIAEFSKERDVYIVCVTKGNSDAQYASDKTADLARIRRQELIESAKVLGVKEVIFLDYDDGTLSNNVYHKVADDIQKVLEKYQPDTVMTYDNKGVSGHLDHIAVSLITTFVFKKLGFVTSLLYYCETKEKSEVMAKDYFIYMPPGYSDEEIDLVVDVEEFWEIKVEAMKKHESQIEDVNRLLRIFSGFAKKDHFLVMKKDYSR